MLCGVGIRVVRDVKDIPVSKERLCVQRYIPDPLLINKLKFDLRVYVLVTSVAPLRIYLYEEGLARFATEEYTTDDSQLDNNFVHLTNYSLNLLSSNFVPNCNPEEAQVCKLLLNCLKIHSRDPSGPWEASGSICC
jgi:tubulin polyglutamylase TTLL4